MNKQYSKEEKKQLIAECQQWIEKGKSISSFAQEKGIPKGTLYCWVQERKSNTNAPKTTLVHIPKVQKETKINFHAPLLVEMRCGSLSFVFNEGYSQESVEATLVSLKKCGLL
jgi:transposase-like protein